MGKKQKQNKNTDKKSEEKKEETVEEKKEEKVEEKKEEKKDQDSDDYQEFEHIIKKRTIKQKDGTDLEQYFVKWKGKGATYNSWEPKSNFRNDSLIFLKELDNPKQPKTYEKMIVKAIKNVNARGGTTSNAICTFIKSRFLVKDGYKKHVHAKLKELSDDNIIIKTEKGTYKLKKTATKKRKVVQKTTTPKKKKTDTKSSKKEEEEEEEDAVDYVETNEEEEEEEVVEKEKKTKSGYLWQYYDNGWHNYDFDASEMVDEVYQQWKKNPGDFDVRSVHSGQFNYMVDFRQMTQQNIDHENHTVRKIRRQQQ